MMLCMIYDMEHVMYDVGRLIPQVCTYRIVLIVVMTSSHVVVMVMVREGRFMPLL